MSNARHAIPLVHPSPLRGCVDVGRMFPGFHPGLASGRPYGPREKCRTPNAERRTPNAERRTPNAECRMQNGRPPVTVTSTIELGFQHSVPFQAGTQGVAVETTKEQRAPDPGHLLPGDPIPSVIETLLVGVAQRKNASCNPPSTLITCPVVFDKRLLASTNSASA